MQDAGTNLSSVAATVSLLVLIVVELASFARDNIDRPGEVVGASTVFGMGHRGWWPSLGQLVVVHTLNLVVLAVATFLVFSVSGQPVSIALLIIILLVAVALPMLEVGEYREIGSANRFPCSLVCNGLAVVAFTVVGAIWTYNETAFPGGSLDAVASYPNGLESLLQSRLVLSVLGVVTVGILNYCTLVQLERELKEAARDGNTDQEEANAQKQNWYP
jgi:hypothetical protein